MSLLQVDPIELEFGYGIIPLADVNQGGDLLDRVVMIRRQIALELGTVVPIIRLRDNIQLNPNQYIIKIKGIQVTEGEILFDHYMAMNPGYVEEEITGIPTFEPSFHLPAIWITESQRERAESLGYTVVDPPSIIATHLTEVIRSHIAELLTMHRMYRTLFNNLKESNPILVDELVPKPSWTWRDPEGSAESALGGISHLRICSQFLRRCRPCAGDQGYRCVDGVRTPELKARDLQQIFPGE